MPLEDLEAPDFVEPDPGLSRAEDEEMFRVQAHRLGRFIHGEISSEVTQTTSKILPRHIKNKNLAPLTAKTTRNTNREESVSTEKQTQTAKKLKKPRKPREPSVKKPNKTKTTRRKRLPLDQVPDTVMPALNAVTLTQRVELVGPKLAAHGMGFGRTSSRTQPHAIRHMVNMHDMEREAKTHNTESTHTESLLGLAGSIPSDLGLEEVYQLHDVSYESRDIALESDFDGSSDGNGKSILTDLQTNTAPGSSVQETPNSLTHAHTDTRPGSTQPHEDGDEILRGSHDASSLLACAPGDASIEITSVKPLSEIIYVDEVSREMDKSREAETEKSRDSYLLAAGSDDDVSCSSPPPTFNYNNYKSFLTIVESDIIHVSDSDSEVTDSCAKARSFDTRNMQQKEVNQALDITYEGSDPDFQHQKTLLDNGHIYHETTPVRTVRLIGKAKKPNVDEYGVPIHRMINTLDGPTRVYRMCSSDSDETDSWTPGKSREIMLRETEQRDDHMAISSSPVLSCSTPRAPTKSLLHSPGGLSSPEGSSSSGSSSIISMTVGTGKPIHAPISYVQSRFFSTKPKASESASDVTSETRSRATRLGRQPEEVDLTELSQYTNDNSEMELFVPESPEAALGQDPLPFEVCELDDFSSIVMPGDSTSRESSPSVIAGRFDGKADSSVIEVQDSGEIPNHKQYGSSPTTKSRSPRGEGKRAKNVTSTQKKKGKQSEDSGLTVNPMASIPPSTQATASMAAELLEKGEVDKIKISELTEFIMSAPEAREMWLKMLTFEPIPLSQLMEFNKRHGLKISKVLTIAWCDLHGVTWTSRDEEKEANEDSEG